MNKEYKIRDFRQSDLKDMLGIFNLFTKTSSAVYCDFELNIDQFKKLLEPVINILIVQNGRKTIGFGYLSKYKPFQNFNHTAVLTYFIKSEYTENGLGTELLNKLFKIGREQDINNYLAHISSKNIQSINFHKKHGFQEVGRFRDVGEKFNDYFDVIWFQKQLN